MSVHLYPFTCIAGSGSYGRLGNLESTDQLFLDPVELLAGEIVKQIAGGNSFTLALTNDGVVHGFGRNDKGNESTDAIWRIFLLFSSACLPCDSTVSFHVLPRHAGQLGTGGGMMVDMYAMSSLPTPIEGQLENRTVAKIGTGHSHSACITNRGELFIWGMNRYLEPELVTSLLHTKVSFFP